MRTRQADTEIPRKTEGQRGTEGERPVCRSRSLETSPSETVKPPAPHALASRRQEGSLRLSVS